MSNNTKPTETETTPLQTIIIAEDSIPNQKILQHLLIKLGYNVIACNNGYEAWKKLNDPETKDVVAIISDMMMPEEDGITFLKKTRESEKFKELPFVIVTAVSDKGQIVLARQLNVTGYILKPVTFQRVTAKLQEIFPGKKFPKVAA
ncbi:MAG: response regulator [Bdellovibrionales bacterium]